MVVILDSPQSFASFACQASSTTIMRAYEAYEAYEAARFLDGCLDLSRDVHRGIRWTGKLQSSPQHEASHYWYVL